MELFYRELGEGAPIVVLHGVFGTSDNWLTTSKGLAENHKVYLLDLRNHGQSFHSDIFTYDAMAEDVKNFIANHHIVNPVILGHSMGGKVAMQYARNYDDFSKLIVVDISPRFYKRHHDDILTGLNSLDLNAITTRQQADEQLSAHVPELGVRQFLLKNLYRNEENKFAWRLNLKVLTDKIDVVGEALPEDTRISKPALFIRGGLSRYIQEKDEVLIRRLFADVQIRTVEGAGHWVQAEKPREFVEVVKEFLGENQVLQA